MTPRQIEIITQIKSLLSELSKPERPEKGEPRVSSGGPPPFGYSSQPRTSQQKAWKERLPLIENRSEQNILEFVRESRERDLTFQRIADLLNAAGYRTRAGGPWVFQSVQRLPFNNPNRKSAA